MGTLQIIPWKSHEDLLQARHLFYRPSSSPELDGRREACDLVEVWKLRGDLPHHVESTWLITEAILDDESDLRRVDKSPFQIQSGYALAFNIFVTRLVDYQKRLQESSRLPRVENTMFALASTIDLPASFVEFRHEITHGHLPSLLSLRSFSKKALAWLWVHYWRRLDVSKGGLAENGTLFGDGLVTLKDQFREVLRGYLKYRTQSPKDTLVPSKISADPKTGETVLELIRLCGSDTNALDALCAVLIEPKILVPGFKNLGTNMQPAFEIWDQFLKTLARHQPEVLCLLLEEMTRALCVPSILDVSIDTNREAIYMWLEHILTTKAWAPTLRRGHNTSTVMRACLMNLNHWARLLLTKVAVNGPSPAIRSQWGKLAEIAIHCQSTTAASSATWSGGLTEDRVRWNSAEAEITSSQEDSDKAPLPSVKTRKKRVPFDPSTAADPVDLTLLASQGLELADNWVPKPLGML